MVGIAVVVVVVVVVAVTIAIVVGVTVAVAITVAVAVAVVVAVGVAVAMTRRIIRVPATRNGIPAHLAERNPVRAPVTNAEWFARRGEQKRGLLARILRR